MFNSPDEKYMRRCLALAAEQKGNTYPNPLVGCVLVKNNQIIGQGAHAGAGKPHAEIIALQQAGKNAQGATLYVNLEPCCHFGKTPPCTDAIIRAHIARVVFAIKDPNPLVKNGQGLRTLHKAHIHVTTGVLKKEAKKLNEVFLTFYEKKKPFIFLKLASSLDGKIASRTGKSKWITGPAARTYVQLLRKEAGAILTGVNTIIKDNPRFTIRDKKNLRQPLLVILDSKLRIPLKAQALREKSVVITTINHRQPKKIQALAKKGVEVIIAKQDSNNHVDIKDAVRILSKKNIMSIMIEAGGEIAASALEANIVDKLYYFIAPLIIGGRTAIPAIGGVGIDSLANKKPIKDISYTSIGHDMLIQGYF